MKRWFVVFGLLFVLVGADQVTKLVASDRLASARWGHEIHLVSPQEQSVEELLTAELSLNTEDEVKGIARKRVKNWKGKKLRGIDTVEAGDKVRVTHRKIVIIPNYFDFQYTRNPGAAFGFLSGEAAWVRLPLFIIMTTLALIFLGVMIKGLGREQRVLFLALCLIASGALGNMIDRIAYGWVIDFIVWKYTDQYRWPTFNLADVWIVVGSALVILGGIKEAASERQRANAIRDEEE